MAGIINDIFEGNGVQLPNTTSTAPIGQIQWNATRFIHNFGTQNFFLGASSGNLTLSGSDNAALGRLTLTTLSSGSQNTAVGNSALTNLASGARNTAIGYLALGNNLSNNNTAIGTQAMQGAAGSSAETNVAVGYQALLAATSCVWNVAVGSQALDSVTSGNQNVGVGQEAVGSITTGSFNIGVGFQAGNSLTTNNSSNIMLNAPGSSGDNNTLRIGSATGTGNQQLNRAFIHGVRGITSGSTNRYPVNVDVNGQLDGTGNLYLPTTSSTVGQIFVNNIRFAHNYLVTNTFLGADVGNFTMSGTLNVGIGTSSLGGLTSGTRNTAVGWGTMFASTTAADNVAVGNAALTAQVASSFNTMVGSYAGTSITNGADANTGIGHSALRNITTGLLNSTLGHDAGRNLTGSDSSNILINNSGSSGDNNTLRFGDGTGTSNRQLNRAFIHGIRGITTGVNDAIAVLIDSAGQLGTVSSSVKYKHNIKTLSETQVLKLRPVSFNYKIDNRSAIGLIAEEVEQVAPELVAYNENGQPESVKYHDLPVLLLTELKTVVKRLDELTKRVEQLENEVQGDY